MRNYSEEPVKSKTLLLTKFTTRELSLDQFNTECAYWFIECEDIDPYELPKKPQKYEDYEAMSEMDKKGCPRGFWLQDDIKTYIDKRSWVEAHNRGQLSTLVEFKEYIPKKDTKTLDSFDYLIGLYGGRPKKKTFVENSLPKEISDINELFDGDIVE